jgi:hypothetical protein
MMLLAAGVIRTCGPSSAFERLVLVTNLYTVTEVPRVPYASANVKLLFEVGR